MEDQKKVTLLLEDYLEINDKLQKWIKLPPDQVMQMLRTLLSSKISRKDLKSSRLDLTLNSIIKTTISSKDHRLIIELVKTLRESWKKQLLAEGADEKKPDALQSSSLTMTRESSMVSMNAPKSPVLEKTMSIGQLQLPELKDGTRNFALKKLAEALSAEETLAKLRESDPQSKYLNPAELSRFIVALEQEIFKHHAHDYAQFARERVLMMKNRLNQQLKYGLLEGTLTILEFATKDSKELESDEIRKMMEEAHKYGMAALQSDFYLKNTDIKEGEFQCGKCKCKKIASVQKQMRSADEPMTTFFHCSNCNNRWKIS